MDYGCSFDSPHSTRQCAIGQILLRVLRVEEVTAANSKWKTLLSAVSISLSELRTCLNFDRDFHIRIKRLSVSCNIRSHPDKTFH